jgi:3-hydroxyisobutyrate dehydrogenase
MKISSQATVIGFIGIGVMGKNMALHLMAAGYKLNIYNRTKAKTSELLEKGAMWFENSGKVAANSEVVITMVGYPHDVEDVYLGEDGIINNSQKGTILIDMTTSSPQLAVKIFEKAKCKGLAFLDAPVSGGDIGAKGAQLSIMVGGEEEVFETAKPLFQLMGKNIVYQGKPGSGQHCKMANQIAIASTMMGVCESLRYAEMAGLNPETVLKSIEAGAAGSWSLSNLAPRIIKGDFAPGFYVKHFIKDMNIALESSACMGLSPLGLALAKSMYDQIAKDGGENLGSQALYKYCK